MNNNTTNNGNDNTNASGPVTDSVSQAPLNSGVQTPITAADIPLALKARYFGSGVAVGVLISPLVKSALGKLQPKLSGLMETLTGQAEGAVEKGSDWLAAIKQMAKREDEDSPSSNRPAGWN